MKHYLKAHRGGAILLAALAFFSATAAGAPQLTGLGKLESGQWELRETAKSAPFRKMCLGDPRQLLQPRHAGQNCNRFVVTDVADHMTVTYTCPAAGNGRTDIRIETARLAQIQTSGVADSQPFALNLEARRVGDCPN